MAWVESAPCIPDAAPSAEQSSAVPEAVELPDALQSELRAAVHSLKRLEALREELESRAAVRQAAPVQRPQAPMEREAEPPAAQEQPAAPAPQSSKPREQLAL